MSLTLVDMKITELKPYMRNARTHDRDQVAQIAESIRSFGFTNPVLIDEKNEIIAGHGRLEAAKRLDLKTLPVIRLEGLSDAKKRALRLADNKIALNAGWDIELLASELADLSLMELDFEITATGFEVAEIDLTIGVSVNGPAAAETLQLPDMDQPALTRRGDLWLLGEHRVLCGDARNPEEYQRLMNGRKAHMGFTDPPYNVSINGHVCGNGRVQHREFAQASGEMTADEFEAFLAGCLGQGARHCRDGAVWFTFMDWRHAGEVIRAGEKVFGDWLNLCIWAKTNGGMGSLYRSQHELIFVHRVGRASHRNNVRLGKFGRNRTNLWTYPGVNTFRKGRMEELSAHPTAKPVALVLDAILDVSARNEIVLDPFLGAGATLIAAERVGRICHGLEIDPAYVDVILRRWRDETGREPVRADDGRDLSTVERDTGLEAAE